MPAGDMQKGTVMTQYEKLVVSGYTGILMTNMVEFQNFVEQTLGRPVQTIELADQRIWEVLKDKLKPEFLKLCNEHQPLNDVIKTAEQKQQESNNDPSWCYSPCDHRSQKQQKEEKDPPWCFSPCDHRSHER